MKYVEIMLLLICLNMSFTVVDTLGLVPLGPGINSSYRTAGSVDISEFGEDYTINKTDNIGYEFIEAMENKKYSGATLTTNLFQDTDFLTGAFIMIELFGKGLFFLGTTLNALGIPAGLHFMIIVPIYFMYLLALFQVISGRNVEANK